MEADIQNLVIGSLVQLNSGGPLMTVNSINVTTCDVTCVWFTDEEFRTANFNVSSLRFLT